MIVLPPLSIGFTDVTASAINELDPNGAYTSTLVRFNGAHNSTTIVDEGPNSKIFTAVGDAKLTTASPKYGSACGIFSGSGGAWTTPFDADMPSGTEEFCIEIWAWVSSSASNYIVLTIGTNSNLYPYQIYYNSGANKFSARGYAVGPYMLYDSGASGPTISLNQWYHLALQRKNENGTSTISFAVGGTVVYSTSTATSTQLFDASAFPFSIGGYSGGTFSLNGKLDGLRITTNAARYSGTTFTPPTDEYATEASYPIWLPASAYIAGDQVFRAETQKLYESLSPTSTVDSTLPEVSITMAAPLWREVGYINKYKMFDYTRNQTTNSIGSLSVTLTKATRIGAVGLVGMSEVSNIKIEQYIGGSWSTLHNVSNSYVQDSETKYYATRVFGDIPPYYNTPIRIILTASGTSTTLSIAYLMLGFVEDIGKIQNGLSVDAINYSKVDRDIYGNTSMVRRRNVPRISGNTLLDPTQVDRVAALRDKLNAMPALWLGVDSVNDIYYNSLAIVGFYRTFSFALDNPVAVQTTLEIEEL